MSAPFAAAISASVNQPGPGRPCGAAYAANSASKSASVGMYKSASTVNIPPIFAELLASCRLPSCPYLVQYRIGLQKMYSFGAAISQLPKMALSTYHRDLMFPSRIDIPSSPTTADVKNRQTVREELLHRPIPCRHPGPVYLLQHLVLPVLAYKYQSSYRGQVVLFAYPVQVGRCQRPARGHHRERLIVAPAIGVPVNVVAHHDVRERLAHLHVPVPRDSRQLDSRIPFRPRHPAHRGMMRYVHPYPASHRPQVPMAVQLAVLLSPDVIG